MSAGASVVTSGDVADVDDVGMRPTATVVVKYHDLARIEAPLVARNLAYLAGVWGTIGAAAASTSSSPPT